MRFNVSVLLSAFLVSTAKRAIAEPAEDLRKEAVRDGGVAPTIFNGETVPPMVDLSGTTIQQDISKGYWLVEAFSPYCHHCKSLAPKLQTLYEFYYTSDPVPASKGSTDPSSSLNSFSRYYDFQFAKLDCVAFGTACTDIGVASFPTLILFKDGKEIKKSVGDRSMKSLSGFFEECLETIRPGSRPADGPKLPEVGSHGDPSLAKHKQLPESKDASQTNKFTKTNGNPKYKVAPVNFIAPTRLPNPDGKSINFTASSFDERVTKTLDPWFLKFYAPWCPHCQAMAASWDAMAREVKGKLDVGDINCDKEKKLCRSMGVQSYPTMMLLRGPERIDYDGLRGFGDLVDYASRAADAFAGVEDVDAAQFEELEKTEEVIFLYFYDVATTAEDLQALERLPMHLNGRAKIVKTDNADLVKRFRISTWPKMIVSRDSHVDIYPGHSPAQMRDVSKLTSWMQSVRLPLVPELTAANANDVMGGKFVVLAILSRERGDEYNAARRELLNAALEWMEKEDQVFAHKREELRNAKQLRVEEAERLKDEEAVKKAKLIRVDMDKIKRKEVAFAWVDGIFWERWARSNFGISVKDGEKVIVYDHDNRQYWDVTSTGNAMVPSRTSILETLPKVVSNPSSLPPKTVGTGFSHMFWRVRNGVKRHPILATMLAVTAIIVWVYGLRTRRRRSGSFGSGGMFKLGEKEGLLGMSNSPNGKSD